MLSFDVIEKYKAQCDGKQDCPMRESDSKWNGDPCKNVWKYTAVKFKCVWGKI